MNNIKEKYLKKIQHAAESIIYLDEVNNLVIKKRIKKRYRLPEIDDSLRKFRTKSEASLIRKASRIGIDVPKIFCVGDDEIKMEYLGKKKIRDVITKKNYIKICKKIGFVISQLHKNNIIHGDLTTSNMILKEDRIYLIDFGLGFHSSRIEDKATDLHLLFKALESTHFSLSHDAWNVIINSYKENYGDADRVLSRLKKIKERGRYKKNPDRKGF
ncbi:MAG: Kae1-associated kinase Bud32 [Candidatus Aenigmatarchaeota archaeon]|nr:MAG: Kae1-associated kinase Bud32 [Candidatus Aenigmarchaeota archaeon]